MKQKVRYLFVGWHPVTGKAMYKEMYRMEEVGDTPPEKVGVKVWGVKFDENGKFKSRDVEMKGEAKRKALLVVEILKEEKNKGACGLSPAVKKEIEVRYMQLTKDNLERIAKAKYVFTGGKVGSLPNASQRMNLGK